MVLAGHEEGVILAVHLNNLHALIVRAGGHELQALLFKGFHHRGVHLEAMAVSLADLYTSAQACGPTLLLAVEAVHHRALGAVLEEAHALAQAHGATLLLHVVLGHGDNHGVAGARGELLRVCVAHLADVSMHQARSQLSPRVAHHRHLQAQADAQVGLLLHTGEGGCLDHALHAAAAEAAGHQNAVSLVQTVPGSLVLGGVLFLHLVLQVGGLHPVDDRHLVQRVGRMAHGLRRDLSTSLPWTPRCKSRTGACTCPQSRCARGCSPRPPSAPAPTTHTRTTHLPPSGSSRSPWRAARTDAGCSPPRAARATPRARGRCCSRRARPARSPRARRRKRRSSPSSPTHHARTHQTPSPEEWPHGRSRSQGISRLHATPSLLSEWAWSSAHYTHTLRTHLPYNTDHGD